MSFLKTTPTYQYTRTPLRGDFAKSACAKNSVPEIGDVIKSQGNNEGFEFRLKGSGNNYVRTGDFMDFILKFNPSDNGIAFNYEGDRIELTIFELLIKSGTKFSICSNNTSIVFVSRDYVQKNSGSFGPDSEIQAELFVHFDNCSEINVGGLNQYDYFPVYCE